MDQTKIGSFLKELRKQKGLTQEQLAEEFNVASRTVSRWETGNNMPDLSILVELADFYDVDIREIINGERKSEIMNTEMKDTLVQVAEYADNEKQVLLNRVRDIGLIGFFAFLASNIMPWETLPDLAIIHMLEGIMIGITGGALIVTILYATGVLAKIRAKAKENGVAKRVLIAYLVICALMVIAAIVRSFV